MKTHLLTCWEGPKKIVIFGKKYRGWSEARPSGIAWQSTKPNGHTWWSSGSKPSDLAFDKGLWNDLAVGSSGSLGSVLGPKLKFWPVSSFFDFSLFSRPLNFNLGPSLLLILELCLIWHKIPRFSLHCS